MPRIATAVTRGGTCNAFYRGRDWWLHIAKETILCILIKKKRSAGHKFAPWIDLSILPSGQPSPINFSGYQSFMIEKHSTESVTWSSFALCSGQWNFIMWWNVSDLTDISVERNEESWEKWSQIENTKRKRQIEKSLVLNLSVFKASLYLLFMFFAKTLCIFVDPIWSSE